MRRLPRARETPTGILAASDVFANVPERPVLAARDRFAGARRLVAHSGLIGPTSPEWSLGCLLIAAEFTSRPTRLN